MADNKKTDKVKEELKKLEIDRVRSPMMEGIYQGTKQGLGILGKGIHQGAALVNYGGAGIFDYALGTKFLPAATEEVGRAFDLNAPVAQPAVATRPAGIGASPVVRQGAPAQAAPKEKKPSLEDYDSIYDAVGALSDEGFVRFVKEHGDKVPGLGFAIDKSGKVIRSIAPPSIEAEGVGPASMKEAELGLRGRAVANQEAQLQNEIDKIAKTTDLTLPANYFKLVKEMAGEISEDTNENGRMVTRKTPDYAGAMIALKRMGVNPPKGSEEMLGAGATAGAVRPPLTAFKKE
jgi:hypothetical protein